MRYNRIITVFAVAFMLIATGCNTNAPDAVAEKFLNAFYHMEYDKAREVSTDEAKELVNLMEQFATQQPDSVKQNAKKKQITILNTQESEDGDKAEVTYTVSGEPGEQKLKLVKQNGQWLVSHSKQDDIDEAMEDDELPEEATTVD